MRVLVVNAGSSSLKVEIVVDAVGHRIMQGGGAAEVRRRAANRLAYLGVRSREDLQIAGGVERALAPVSRS